MASNYASHQLESANYKLLEDGSIFGEIPRFKGVWASGSTLERCRHELHEVLEDWLAVQTKEQL